MEYVQWLHESDWKILRVYGTPSPKCPQITLNQKTTKMKKKNVYTCYKLMFFKS